MAPRSKPLNTTFDKTKFLRLTSHSLKDVLELARKAEAFDIAVEITKRLDTVGADIRKAKVAKVTYESTRQLEYLQAVQDTYIELMRYVMDPSRRK